MSRRARDDRELNETLEWLATVEAAPEAEWPQPQYDPSEKLTQVVPARFQPSLYAAMRVAAALTGVNVSEWIRAACVHRLVTEDRHRAAISAAYQRNRERPAPAPGGDAAP